MIRRDRSAVGCVACGAIMDYSQVGLRFNSFSLENWPRQPSFATFGGSIMQLDVHGVRGSHPVPGPATVRAGGNTTCYSVTFGHHRIVLDAGTGIIALGKQMVREHLASKEPIFVTLLISHTHHDHTQGFPFFAPVYFGTTHMHMYGPNTNYLEIEEALSQGLAAPFFPVNLSEMQCMKHISPISDADELLFFADSREPVLRNIHHGAPPGREPIGRVRVMKGYNHPKNGVLHFRIESGNHSIVYATDTEGYEGGDERLIRFAKDCDILVHDAQYLPEEYVSGPLPRQGWGHSTWKMACDVARRANAKTLLLHHHDPERTDDAVDAIEAAARAVFPGAQAAREGMSITA